MTLSFSYYCFCLWLLQLKWSILENLKQFFHMMHDGNMQWCIFWANEAWNYLIFFPLIIFVLINLFLTWSNSIHTIGWKPFRAHLILCTSNYLVKTCMKIKMRYATSEKVLPNCDHSSLTPTYLWQFEFLKFVFISRIIRLLSGTTT